MFAFTVSTRLYRIALAFAPVEDSIITKFLRPMVKGRIACSLSYTDIRIRVFKESEIADQRFQRESETQKKRY